LADNSGCCPAAQSTYSNCPVGLNSGDAKVTGRVAYGPGAVSASYDYYGFNQDFILASTYQDSYTGLGDRADAPLNYCDQ